VRDPQQALRSQEPNSPVLLPCLWTYVIQTGGMHGIVLGRAAIHPVPALPPPADTLRQLVRGYSSHVFVQSRDGDLDGAITTQSSVIGKMAWQQIRYRPIQRNCRAPLLQGVQPFPEGTLQRLGLTCQMLGQDILLEDNAIENRGRDRAQRGVRKPSQKRVPNPTSMRSG